MEEEEEEHEAALSPIVTKIVRNLATSPKPHPFSLSRLPTPPRQIILQQWWLSKPKPLLAHGFAVSGRTSHFTRCDIVAVRKSGSAAPPPKRRNSYASREYHSQVIVKRHDRTTLETSDGVIVSLCGHINSSRSNLNGFSSQVCRDFSIGFPYNWDDYAASVGEKSSQGGFCLEELTDSFLSADLDGCNGAQLHDLVFSRSDAEREFLHKKVYDDLVGMLDLQPINEESQLSKSTQPLSRWSEGSKKRKLFV